MNFAVYHVFSSQLYKESEYQSAEIRLITATFFRQSSMSNIWQHLLCMSVLCSAACSKNCDFCYVPIISSLVRQINEYFSSHYIPLLPIAV